MLITNIAMLNGSPFTQEETVIHYIIDVKNYVRIGQQVKKIRNNDIDILIFHIGLTIFSNKDITNELIGFRILNKEIKRKLVIQNPEDRNILRSLAGEILAIKIRNLKDWKWRVETTSINGFIY